jgi:hypothetical protein
MSSPAGFSGIVGIIVAVIGVGIVMSLVLDMWSHWLPIAVGILVGLWAVQSINR